MEQDVDYRAIFRSIPAVMVVLSPDFAILDVSDETAELVGRTAQDLAGKNLFATFRPNPDDPSEPGPPDLRASLAKVLATGERDMMPVTRYDLEDPDTPGLFVERYWAVVNIPVMAAGQVKVIIFRAVEMTHMVHAAQTVT
jgi:PAS domain-containing protein